MKSIFLRAITACAALLALVSFAHAQWTSDCNTVSSTGTNVQQGLLQMRAAGDAHALYYYICDSLRLRIFANPCSQTATYTYTMNTNERSAYYRYVYATPLDFTGDGVNEIILLTYYYVNNNYRTALKIFDVTNGTVLLERRDPNLIISSYPYSIADVNGDGTIECVVTIQNGNQFYSEIYNTGLSASGLPNNPAATPQFQLEQNYPNPFNPVTRIDYSLSQPGNVSIEIFNMLGQKVTSLVNGYQPQGEHSVEWNSTDEHGMTLGSGTYLYEVSLNGKPSGTKKMILLR